MAPLVSSAVVAALVASAGIATALPPRIGTTANGEGTFSFAQVRSGHTHVRSGPVALYKAYLKYGATPPDSLIAAVAKVKASLQDRSRGSVTTTPSDSYDDEYVTPVQIGTPAQTLYLDFDTGSSDLWVLSSETPKSEVEGQPIYNIPASSTATKVSGATWSISYGDGSSSSGDVYTDVVTVGGLTVSKQGVESATKVSAEFSSDTSISGLLGLGFDALNTVKPTKQKTFFSNAKASLDSPLFTADLKHQAPGKYNFGYIDTTAYTGTIAYTSVNSSPGYWTFTSSGYGVGSTFTSTSITGIADTGTTLLLLPASVVSAYYSKVSGASNSNTYGGYIYKCSTTLPTFTVGIGSSRIVIPSSYMNYGPVSTGSSTCYGGLQSSAGIGINIYGDVALKAAFVVFNGASSPTLGWANKTLT